MDAFVIPAGALRRPLLLPEFTRASLLVLLPVDREAGRAILPLLLEKNAAYEAVSRTALAVLSQVSQLPFVVTDVIARRAVSLPRPDELSAPETSSLRHRPHINRDSEKDCL